MTSMPPYSTYPDPYGSRSSRPPLTLPRGPERRIGGVCAGIARYMDMNVTWLRVLLMLSAFLTSGATLVIYVLLWLVIPEDPWPGFASPQGAVAAGYYNPAVISAHAHQPVGVWPERQVAGSNWGPAAPSVTPTNAHGVPVWPGAHHVDPTTYDPMASVYAEAERRIDQAVNSERSARDGAPWAGHPSNGTTAAQQANVVPLRPRPSDTLGERIL